MPRLIKGGRRNQSMPVSITPKGVVVPSEIECRVNSWPSARTDFAITASKDGTKITLTFPDPSWTNTNLFIEIEGQNLQAVIKSSR